MTTIKQMATEYKDVTTRNIAELEKVPVDLKCNVETFKEGTEDEFTANICEIDGVRYRVPNSVLKTLQVILETEKDLKFFNVLKSGEGMNTTYTVLPLK